MYDVIIVGARVAGASTAMLLARRGLRVLAVDRATFPSDTVSTHQVQLPGGGRLRRWGLLEGLLAAGTPPTRRVRFDAGPFIIEGHYPVFDGVDALHSPRRTLLDETLIEAARAAGADVRERVTVDDLTWRDGRVTGIRAREHGSREFVETGSIVIGADGRHSPVARAVGVRSYDTYPSRSIAYYSYFEGLGTDGGEIHARPRDRRMAGVWPTNDGLVLVVVMAPAADLSTFRADIEGRFLAALDGMGDLGERVRAARRADRFQGSADNPNAFRVPFGPGWALAGDAGLTMDPITGLGIGHALRDAELLAEAIDAGLGGRRPLEAALADYQARRDRETRPAYEFTVELASFAEPTPDQDILFGALAEWPAGPTGPVPRCVDRRRADERLLRAAKPHPDGRAPRVPVDGPPARTCGRLISASAREGRCRPRTGACPSR